MKSGLHVVGVTEQRHIGQSRRGRMCGVDGAVVKRFNGGRGR